MLEAHLRQTATILLKSAIRIAPPDSHDWGQAMLGEISYVEGPWAAVSWAVGGASVMVKHALISLFMPRRRGPSLVPDGGLFSKSVSLRKAVFATAAACVLGALLFVAAPPFRQAFRVSLAGWRTVFRVTGQDDQSALIALSRRAEAAHDPDGLVFVAVRLNDALCERATGEGSRHA